jgi:hypothetical protein
MFTTVTEDSYTDYPYHDASGKTVHLAIKDENMTAHVCHYVMLHTAESIFVNNKKQYGLKAGLRKFASWGSTAFTKVFTQLHTLKCFKPIDVKQLSRNARCQALTSLMFLAEKHSGELKARACANGSTQRTHVAKEEATAPTVISKAIFIQCTIFAQLQIFKDKCKRKTCPICKIGENSLWNDEKCFTIKQKMGCRSYFSGFHYQSLVWD